jgi:hypothetical protein
MSTSCLTLCPTYSTVEHLSSFQAEITSFDKQVYFNTDDEFLVQTQKYSKNMHKKCITISYFEYALFLFKLKILSAYSHVIVLQSFGYWTSFQ